MRQGKFVDKNIDPYNEEWNFERNDHKELFVTGFNGNNYLPKRGFIPSKWERLKVSKFIQAMKKGWMKTLAEKA